jgi:hypothetical protein
MNEVRFAKTGPGPSVRTPSGGMGTYGRGALFIGVTRPLIMAGRADLQRHIIYSRQGGPTASQAIGFPVSRWGIITALLIKHRWLRTIVYPSTGTQGSCTMARLVVTDDSGTIVVSSIIADGVGTIASTDGVGTIVRSTAGGGITASSVLSSSLSAAKGGRTAVSL